MQQIGGHPTKTISINIFIDKTVFTDKTDPLDPTRRGFFWMRVLKTMAPLGLNIDEGYNY